MTGVLRARVGDAWVDIGGVGPMGPQGPQGPPGAPGAPGQDVGNHVIKTGDTMTGPLTIAAGDGANGLAFRGWGEYISFLDGGGGGRTAYIQGNQDHLLLNAESGLARIQSGGHYLDIRSSGQHTMVGHLSMAGYNIGSAGVVEANGFNLYGNNSFYFASWGGGWYMTDGTYIRSTNDKHTWIGSGWYGTNGGLSIGYNGTPNWGYSIDCNGGTQRFGNIVTQTGNWTITANGSNAQGWNYAGFITQNSGLGRAFMSWHPGGTAMVVDVQTNGSYLNFLSSDLNGYCSLYCWQIIQVSKRSSKQDIAAWPSVGVGAGALSAADRLSLIDVYRFRQKREHALVQALPARRENALRRLNDWRARSGLEPRPHPLHDCDEHDCDGTGAEPCTRVREWDNPSIGVMIEDLVSVLPEVVALGEDGEPGGIRTNSMLGYLLAVCKEQQERIVSLEAGLGQQQEAA